MADELSHTAAMPKTLSSKEVARYLREHPDFFLKHPKLLTELQFSDVASSKVVDFRSGALAAMQQRIAKVEQEQDDVIYQSRSQRSATRQIRDAVKDVISCDDLEQMMEWFAVDMPMLFDVDVVRLGLESELGEAYESYHPESYYSGLSLLQMGQVNQLFGNEGSVRLSAHAQMDAPWVHDVLFHHCTQLAISTMYLSLPLRRTGRQAVLGLGVREQGVFQPGQRGEVWYAFLGDIIALRLDHLLMQQEGVI